MLLIAVSTFVCIAFGVMAVYWLAFRPVSATATRLKELGDANSGVAPSIEPNTVASLAERLAEPINRLVPPSAANAEKLQKDLMQAGFRSPHATSVFRAAQLLSMIGLPLLVVLVYTFMVWPLSGALIPGLFAVGAGFILPRLVLNRLIASRKLRISWGLDRKSTRLNSSHSQISYAVFCLKKKNNSIALDSACD